MVYSKHFANRVIGLPLAAALVHLVVNGDRKYADIRDAVLVEVAGAAASQVSAARAVLAAITEVPLRAHTAVAESGSTPV